MNHPNGQANLISFKAWIRLLRIPFLTATIIPFVLGTVTAWASFGVFNLAYFASAFVGACFLHLGTNVINDYFDFRNGGDAINTEAISPLTGGSRVLLEGLVKPQSAYLAALLCYGTSLAIAIGLSFAVGWWVLILGIIGAVFGYTYVTRLAPYGVGEFVVGLSFGPLLVLGSYYVQAQQLAVEPIIASMPIGLLVMAILWINEFPDYNADRSVGKKTLVVRMGRKLAADLYLSIMLAAYGWSLAMVALGLMPLFSLMVLLTLPLAVQAIKVARKNYEISRLMVTANVTTIKIQLSFGILMIVSYILNYFLTPLL